MAIGMGWIILYLGLILLRQPYVRKGDDRMQMFVLCELFLLLLAGDVLQNAGTRYVPSFSFII
jgi:hypothetical protein